MNNFIIPILTNQPLAASITAWFAAQTIKVLYLTIINKKFRFEYYALPGGFPSAHSATSVGLAASLGIIYGFGSPYFALATVFAFFIIYDAKVIRIAAGKQAYSLNRLIEHVILETKEDEIGDIQKVKEVLGHSIFEIIAGSIIGVLSAVCIYYIFKIFFL